MFTQRRSYLHLIPSAWERRFAWLEYAYMYRCPAGSSPAHCFSFGLPAGTERTMSRLATTAL